MARVGAPAIAALRAAPEVVAESLAAPGALVGLGVHDIVVTERKLLTQEKWDEVFAFENLISPKFEQ